ncbi:hypothetical protein V4D30_01465 [Thermodesulfovibrio sp. 3907-1M]|uniref:Sporulation stage II protein D amidase enhancer LytB N-terminal domain-containing protein n=1 Tax=Thermodesulfovibrio autotrophicus TaxID=3118333 RepID=A0AAU8GX09_9BACT
MKLIRILIFIGLLILPLNLHGEVLLNQCNVADIKGSFNLIIYSNSFINDPETFLVLDKVDDMVKIVPYASEFKYRTMENLTEKEALKIAEEILKSAYVSSIKCSAISVGGNLAGYELKPIYFPWVFGILEPVETVYKKEGDSIFIFIRLNPYVERQLYFGGDSDKEN